MFSIWNKIICLYLIFYIFIFHILIFFHLKYIVRNLLIFRHSLPLTSKALTFFIFFKFFISYFLYPYIQFSFQIYSVKSFDFPALSPSDEQGSNRKVTLNPIPCSNNQREVAEIFQRILFQRISVIFAGRRRFVKTANIEFGARQYCWQQMKLFLFFLVFFF